MATHFPPTCADANCSTLRFTFESNFLLLPGASQEAADEDSDTWETITYLGDSDQVSGSWLWPDPGMLIQFLTLKKPSNDV